MVLVIALPTADRAGWAGLRFNSSTPLSLGSQSSAAPSTYHRGLFGLPHHWLMASCHMINIVIHNTSSNTHSVSLQTALPPCFHHRRLSPSNPSISTYNFPEEKKGRAKEKDAHCAHYVVLTLFLLLLYTDGKRQCIVKSCADLHYIPVVCPCQCKLIRYYRGKSMTSAEGLLCFSY